MEDQQTQEISHVVCVGAVYIDTILTVPHFPPEDTKLRATKILKRRGGNTPNTLEVLSQLVSPAASPSTPPLHLQLLSILPSRSAPETHFIRRSLPDVDFDSASLFREEHDEAASSYIIQSAASLSRTIVSINPLAEMSLEEFVASVTANRERWAYAWFHFEGRIPDVTLSCVRYLRDTLPKARISLECEKPDRKGLEDVVGLADVVFFSRLWAEGRGFKTAKTFLASQLDKAREGAVISCTWGEGGAAGMKINGEDVDFVEVPAWSPEEEEGENKGGGKGEGKEGIDGQTKGKPKVVDTIGAGDTFIAGMLYAIIRNSEWGLKRQVEFANQIAGRKVLQEGFRGLGEKMDGF